MITTVLLAEKLREIVFHQALKEIRAIQDAGHKSCTLIINSDGGDFVSAMSFVKEVNALSLEFSLKIYEAHSAAAYIALALSKVVEAEMRSGASLGLHQGSVTLNVPLVHPGGRVPDRIMRNVDEYVGLLAEATRPYNFSEGVREKFQANGWAEVPAEECLKLGIVQRLF